MAPKSVFVVVHDDVPAAAYSDEGAANNAAEELDGATVHKVTLSDAKAAPKAKAKPPAKTRAAPKAKASKAAADDGEKSDLATRIAELLEESGDSLDGLTIVVTGVPTDPHVTRKQIDELVEGYGGHLTKSLSKNTSFVVLGANAGPTKLKKIEDLGIETLSHEELVERVSGGGGGKRGAPADDDEAEVKGTKKKRKA